jgi:Protein of unknown function (DUF1091)
MLLLNYWPILLVVFFANTVLCHQTYRSHIICTMWMLLLFFITSLVICRIFKCVHCSTICQLFPYQDSATSNLILTKFTVLGAPGWLNGTASFINTTDDQLIYVNLTLHKVIDFKIMVWFKIMKVDGGIRKKIFDIPKMNYCALQRSGKAVPILSNLFDLAARHSNMVFRCPAKPGFYWAKNYPISDLPLAPILPPGNYVVSYLMNDENQKKVVTFIKMELFLTKPF